MASSETTPVEPTSSTGNDTTQTVFGKPDDGPQSMFQAGVWDVMIEEVESIIEASPIDVYSAGIHKRWGWPWRLMSYFDARPGVAEGAESIMIDSSVSRYGNMVGYELEDGSKNKYKEKGVVDQAEKVGADFIIPPEFTHKCPEYDSIDAQIHAEELFAELTLDRVDMWDNSDVQVLLPLHPPYDEYIYELSHWDFGHVLGLEDDPCFDYPKTDEEMRWYQAGHANYTLTYDLIKKFGGVAIGGLLNLSLEDRIDAIETVIRNVPHDTHIHVLAPGNEIEMIRLLRKYSNRIDSLDISTPESSVGNGKIPDRTGYQHRHLFPAGKNSSTIRGVGSLLTALQMTYMLTDFVNWDKVWNEYLEDQDED